jgi:hypothetical protein
MQGQAFRPKNGCDQSQACIVEVAGVGLEDNRRIFYFSGLYNRFGKLEIADVKTRELRIRSPKHA